MMHNHHESLPDYDPSVILQDGCAECELRGRELLFTALDDRNFERMWKRAWEWNQGDLRTVSQAEVPMLEVLWRIICKLEERGIAGDGCPGGYSDRLGLFFDRMEALDKK
jgi:hypothetical protein